jgi:hypothetical protein
MPAKRGPKQKPPPTDYEGTLVEWNQLSESKRYYLRKRNEISVNGMRYRSENREKIHTRKKKYREDNKDKISEHKKKWAIDNPERSAQLRKESAARCVDRIAAYKRKWNAMKKREFNEMFNEIY